MNKIKVTILLTFLIFLFACEDKAVSHEDDGFRGFLWEVKHEDNIVYLFGSIHIGLEDMYPMHHDVLEAFEKSDYLVVEWDQTNERNHALRSEIYHIVEYHDGRKLQDVISPELYNELDVFLSAYYQKAEQYNRFKPWYVSSVVDLLTLNNSNYAFKEELGHEYYFLNNLPDGMNVLELESPQIIKMFDDLNESVQEYLLQKSLSSAMGYPGFLVTVIDLMRRGDWNTFEQIMIDEHDGSNEYTLYSAALLDNRNIKMVNEIEGFLQSDEQKTYFVVVGAAHYYGELGIINLLKSKGYDVIQK